MIRGEVKFASKHMSNKTICANKICYLILFDVLYIISVLVLFNFMLIYHFLAVHLLNFAIMVIWYT